MGNTPAAPSGSRRLRAEEDNEQQENMEEQAPDGSCNSSSFGSGSGLRRVVLLKADSDPRSPTDGIRRTPITVVTAAAAAQDASASSGTPKVIGGGARWRRRFLMQTPLAGMTSVGGGCSVDLRQHTLPQTPQLVHYLGPCCELPSSVDCDAYDDDNKNTAGAGDYSILDGSAQSEAGLMDSKRSSRRSPLGRLRDSFRGLFASSAAAASAPQTPATTAAPADAAAAASSCDRQSPSSSAPPAFQRSNRAASWRRPCRRRRLRMAGRENRQDS